MRLLVITNDYPPKPGGIQQYVRNLVERFPGDVLVLTSHDASAAEDERVRRGKAGFLWPTPAVLRWVEESAARFRPDAVLFGAPFPLARLGPALRRRLGLPYAVLTHGAEVTVPAAFPIARQAVAGPLRQADLVFTNSRYTNRAVERLLGRPAHSLGIGVDLDLFHPRAATSSPRRRTVVGAVGRFVPRKRHAAVIEAVAALRARGHDVELLLVGRGRLARTLRRRAAALAVPARFEVEVAWDRLPDLYREMDVFALPCRSRWMGLEAEGLGIVFLEAAASGLPVVVGDSGGTPETVAHGTSGFVVRDRTELVGALERLVSNRSLAAAMGAAGRANMAKDHAWEDVLSRLMAGLEEATGLPRPAASRRRRRHPP